MSSENPNKITLDENMGIVDVRVTTFIRTDNHKVAEQILELKRRKKIGSFLSKLVNDLYTENNGLGNTKSTAFLNDAIQNLTSDNKVLKQNMEFLAKELLTLSKLIAQSNIDTTTSSSELREKAQETLKAVSGMISPTEQSGEQLAAQTLPTQPKAPRQTSSQQPLNNIKIPEVPPVKYNPQSVPKEEPLDIPDDSKTDKMAAMKNFYAE